MSDGSDVLERQWLELVLFEEIIQVLLQHLEHQAGVVLVSEALVGADKVELVCILLAETHEERLIGCLLEKKLQVVICVVTKLSVLHIAYCQLRNFLAK